MATQHQDAAAIWKQTNIPVIYRQGGSAPLRIRLPFSSDNRTWLRGDHRRRPVWIAKYTCWEVPKSWFEDLVAQVLHRFGSVYVIQPYRVQEKCAPACWNAQGFECECSCMGAHHGRQNPSGNWRVISDTFAFRWHDRQLACRLIEHNPGNTFDHAGEPPKDREEKDRREIEAILDGENRNPLEPPPEDWLGPLQRIGEERRSSWPAIERGIEKQILTGDHPRVLMFCDTTSTVGQDVRAALGPHPHTYHLNEQQIPWTDAAAVATALSVQKADADLVAIMRGSGEELSALSDRRVIEAVAHQVPIPIVLVVDHADDRPLIQDVMYQAFPTPTALGTWLAGRVTEAHRRRKRGMRAVLVVANRARGLVTSVRNYVGSFDNRLSK